MSRHVAIYLCKRWRNWQNVFTSWAHISQTTTTTTTAEGRWTVIQYWSRTVKNYFFYILGVLTQFSLHVKSEVQLQFPELMKCLTAFYSFEKNILSLNITKFRVLTGFCYSASSLTSHDLLDNQWTESDATTTKLKMCGPIELNFF